MDIIYSFQYHPFSGKPTLLFPVSTFRMLSPSPGISKTQLLRVQNLKLCKIFLSLEFKNAYLINCSLKTVITVPKKETQQQQQQKNQTNSKAIKYKEYIHWSVLREETCTLYIICTSIFFKQAKSKHRQMDDARTTWKSSAIEWMGKRHY